MAHCFGHVERLRTPPARERSSAVVLQFPNQSTDAGEKQDFQTPR
jgi:hypothetical protein